MLFENRLVRVSVYTLCISFVSEMAYHAVKRWRKILVKDEVNEVLYTNDQTQICTASHKSNNVACKNRSCYIRNIARIVKCIDSAKASIDFSMYIFTAAEPAEAVLRAHRRGVRVRVICDESMAFASGSQAVAFHNAGIPVRFQTNSTGLMHHKFCIIDGPYSRRLRPSTSAVARYANESDMIPLLLNGSMNWTFQGFSGNWENLLITSNLELIDQFEQEFQRMWNKFNNKNNCIV